MEVEEEWKWRGKGSGGGMDVEGEWTIEKRTFHSGESRNLILATARIFREAEHCNGRLSANAAVAAEIPAFAGMESFFILARIPFLGIGR